MDYFVEMLKEKMQIAYDALECIGAMIQGYEMGARGRKRETAQQGDYIIIEAEQVKNEITQLLEG